MHVPSPAGPILQYVVHQRPKNFYYGTGRHVEAPRGNWGGHDCVVFDAPRWYRIQQNTVPMEAYKRRGARPMQRSTLDLSAPVTDQPVKSLSETHNQFSGSTSLMGPLPRPVVDKSARMCTYRIGGDNDREFRPDTTTGSTHTELSLIPNHILHASAYDNGIRMQSGEGMRSSLVDPGNPEIFYRSMNASAHNFMDVKHFRPTTAPSFARNPSSVYMGPTHRPMTALPDYKRISGNRILCASRSRETVFSLY